MDEYVRLLDVIDVVKKAGVYSIIAKELFHLEALKMAEDVVSRQAVIDLCERFDGCVPYSVLSNYDMLPSVNPQPKTVLYSGDGYADGYMVYDFAECPNCGYEYEESDKDWGLPFCPLCGQSLNWESEDKG